MSDPASQARALLEGAGVRALSDLIVMRVEGDDALTWINGQVTNDVRAIESGQSVYALIINVKGRVLADTLVIHRGERGFALIVPREAAAGLIEHLDRYIIMEDVELALDDTLRVVTVQGPEAQKICEGSAHERYPSARLGGGGFDLLVSADDEARVLAELATTATLVDAQGWELARLRDKRPALGPDFGESTYPQEAGLESRAVSFQKGCYLGQEVICMLENRGQLNRKLVALAGDADVSAGTAIVDADGKEVGSITSAVRDPDLGRTLALGFVKRRTLEAGSALQAGEVALALRN